MLSRMTIYPLSDLPIYHALLSTMWTLSGNTKRLYRSRFTTINTQRIFLGNRLIPVVYQQEKFQELLLLPQGATARQAAHCRYHQNFEPQRRLQRGSSGSPNTRIVDTFSMANVFSTRLPAIPRLFACDELILPLTQANGA